MALGDHSLGSHSGSPPQIGAHRSAWHAHFLCTASRKGWPFPEHRHLTMPDRPQSRTDSSSLPREAIQTEAARQLAGFDQRAQTQDLEIQRVRKQLEEAPSQTTRTGREQAGGAPTRNFATPEGTKFHRTKTCSTLTRSHRFVEFQLCQQCNGSAADYTQHRTG